MLKHALLEVRYHPARFIATLIAIAISTAFMAGSSIVIATENNSLGSQLARPASNAHLVVTIADPSPPDRSATDVKAALAQVPGVVAAEQMIDAISLIRHGVDTIQVSATLVPSEPFRWANLIQGHWPTASAQIALSESGAKKLGVTLGDVVDNPMMGGEQTVVGITDEPASYLREAAYVHDFGQGNDFDHAAGTWRVKLKPGTDVDTASAAIITALAPLAGKITPVTSEHYRQASVDSLTADLNVLKTLVQVFAVISLVVGVIIISTTFTILVAQRRRQIGLLRAVGASGRQVRGRLLAEALVLGVAGSALGLLLAIGLAAVAALFTGAIGYGLRVPTLDTVVAFGLGVLGTLVAALAPTASATRVMPLEALQPVATVEAERRASRVRAVICGLLVLLGGGLAVVSQVVRSHAVLTALGGAALITLGVLFGASLFVPALMRGFGRLVGGFGPTARLAAANAVRNPKRSAGTATALMLAVGLIVTLQVGTATVKASMRSSLDQAYPVDLVVSGQIWDGGGEAPTLTGLPESLPKRVAGVAGVGDAEPVLGVGAELQSNGSQETREPMLVRAWNDDLRSVVSGDQQPPGPDEILVSRMRGDLTGRVTLKGASGAVELTVRKARLAGASGAMVDPAVLTRLGGTPKLAEVWVSVPDRSNALPVVEGIQKVGGSDIQVAGSVAQAAMIERVLDLLLLITSALLGVAVLIALMGVGNTLALSVLERRRETGLLRALGLQKSSLQAMLAIEAVLMALAGTLVGLVAGVLFGWLGTSAIVKEVNDESMRYVFAVDVWQTLGMVGIAVLAGLVASVLPGLRAARVTPTAALAEE